MENNLFIFAENETLISRENGVVDCVCVVLGRSYWFICSWVVLFILSQNSESSEEKN